MNEHQTWHVTASTSASTTPMALRILAQVFDQLEVPYLALQSGQHAWALLGPFPSLISAIGQDNQYLTIDGIRSEDVEVDARLLFSSSGQDEDSIEALFSFLQDENLGVRLPTWIGVEQAPHSAHESHAGYLGARGMTATSGTVTVHTTPDEKTTYHLYHNRSDQLDIMKSLAEGPKEPFEGEDNLAGRAEWFQRQTYGGKTLPPDS